MPRRSQRIRQMKANRLEAALSMRDTSHPETEPLVRVAGLLAPGVPIRANKQADARAAMLAAAREAFAAAGEPVRSSVSGAPVHTAEVETAAGRVRLADVEAISSERAQEIAAELAGIDQYGGLA